MVLEVARTAVNEQVSSLWPMLYPGKEVTGPKTYVSLYAMWRALVTSHVIQYLPSAVKIRFPRLFLG